MTDPAPPARAAASRGGPIAWARIVFAAAFALAGVLAVADTWARLTASDHPQRVLAAFPGHPEALLARIDDALAGTDGRIAPSTASDARRVLQAAPLADAPLIYLGLGAFEAGDRPRAEAAMAAAVRRNPRRPASRIWFLERALAQGDHGAALDALSVLYEIDRGRARAYVAAAAAIAADPRSHAAILARVGDDPPWADDVVRRLNQSYPDLMFLMELNTAYPRHRGWLITRLASENAYRRAFLAWLSFLPAADAADLSWPYNPTFDTRSAPPPFNWRIRERQAEIAADGGLVASYLGRSRPTFAAQVMLLPPQRYVFSATMQVRTREGGGGFAWSVSCLHGEEEYVIGQAASRDLEPGAEDMRFGFSVPAERCAAQELTLRGAPGAFPFRARAIVREVRIEAAPPLGLR